MIIRYYLLKEGWLPQISTQLCLLSWWYTPVRSFHQVPSPLGRLVATDLHTTLSAVMQMWVRILFTCAFFSRKSLVNQPWNCRVTCPEPCSLCWERPSTYGETRGTRKVNVITSFYMSEELGACLEFCQDVFFQLCYDFCIGYPLSPWYSSYFPV
jgi:hypothetical protein